MTLFRLDGHTAIVTGASRGLGAAMAAGFAEAGAKVIRVSSTDADLRDRTAVASLRDFARRLVARKSGGRIINIASMLSFQGGGWLAR